MFKKHVIATEVKLQKTIAAISLVKDDMTPFQYEETFKGALEDLSFIAEAISPFITIVNSERLSVFGINIEQIKIMQQVIIKSNQCLSDIDAQISKYIQQKTSLAQN